MPHKPERPFIPSSAPGSRRPPAGAASFHLARPFVHGASAMNPSGSASMAVESAPESDDFGVLAGAPTETSPSFAPLPSIDDFLETVPASDQAYAAATDALDYTATPESSYELPPVEHFLDPLPLVDALAPDAGEILTDAPELNGAVTGSVDYQTESGEGFGLEETGWVDTGWQEFDWSGAAALGEGANEASDAWRETDWETTAPPVREFRETAAQAIANALDEIASRIRNGELAVPSPGVVTDPAAIAATLAALLGVRR